MKETHPDFDTYSEPDREIEELTPYFPTYIVLESVEDKPITEISPFIIEKFLSANMAPKSVKTICNNTLIVEGKKQKNILKLLLRTTTLDNMKMKLYSHRSFKTSKGAVRSPELATFTIEEIKQNMKKQLMTDVKKNLNKEKQSSSQYQHLHALCLILPNHHQNLRSDI